MGRTGETLGWMFKAVVPLMAVLLLTSAANGQGVQEQPDAEQPATSRLRIPAEVDLAKEIARIEGLHRQKMWSELATLFDKLLKSVEGKLIRGEDGLYGGAGGFLREKMVRLGPRLREEYRIRHDRAAGRAYDAAAAMLEEKRLEELAWDYPMSSFTDNALSMLATMSAERGDYEGASRYLDRLFRWCRDSELEKEPLLLRAAWYCFYAGRLSAARRYLDELNSDDGEKLAEAVRLRLAQLVEKLGSGAAPVQGVEDGAYQSGIPGGGFGRACVSEELADYNRIAWQGGLLEGRSIDNLQRRGSFRFNQRRRAIAPGSDDYRYQSVAYGEKLYAGTEAGVSVFDMRTGKLAMKLRAPGAGELFPGIDSYLAPTVTEDRVYANFVYEVSNSEDYNGILIKAAIPRYTLCAFDRKTGKLLWVAHKDKAFRDSFSGRWFSIPSAPVVFEGMLIAEVKSRGQLAGSHLAAFDARTGEMKWVRPLCSNGTELTMFGYDARGPLSTMLAFSGGPRATVYCCTNLGAVFAVDARTGDIRWARSYDEIPLRAARHYYAQMRNIVWANNPPAVSGGVLVVAPLDSEHVYAYDTATGEMLWQYGYSWQQSQLRHILGVGDEKVLLSGRRLVAIGLRTGKVKWLSQPFSVMKSGGRGLVTGSEVVVPQYDGIYRFNLKSGKTLRIDSWITAGSANEPGNILEAEGRLVVTGKSKVTVYDRSPGR